jgi:hypothetical protein
MNISVQIAKRKYGGLNKMNFNEQFEIFIKKWCGNSSAHLLDTDENDGQELREFVEDNYIEREKVTDAFIQLAFQDLNACGCEGLDSPEGQDIVKEKALDIMKRLGLK